MLRVCHLHYAYKSGNGEPPVFRDLNIDFKSGLNVVLGPNGAGKSTLLKCMFGILRPKGEIYYGERELTGLHLDEMVRLMSYLPQMESNRSSLRVLEVVLLGRLAHLGRRVRDEDLDIVMETLEFLHIAPLAKRPISELSGGQQKLVSIAQTLVRKPRLILMDEPTNFLDLQKQLELCQMLREIVARRRIDVVMALHDLNLAARYADHVVTLDNQGRLFNQGEPKAAITREMLEVVYGVHARVTHDEKGIPMVSPVHSLRATGLENVRDEAAGSSR